MLLLLRQRRCYQAYCSIFEFPMRPSWYSARLKVVSLLRTVWRFDTEVVASPAAVPGGIYRIPALLALLFRCQLALFAVEAGNPCDRSGFRSRALCWNWSMGMRNVQGDMALEPSNTINRLSDLTWAQEQLGDRLAGGGLSGTAHLRPPVRKERCAKRSPLESFLNLSARRRQLREAGLKVLAFGRGPGNLTDTSAQPARR